MLYKKAKLYDAGGNLDVRWKVYYSYKNPDTGKFQRFSSYVSSTIHTRSERHKCAKKMITLLNSKLSHGLNPFSGYEQSLKLMAALNYFMESKQRMLRPRTMHSYGCYINDFKRWARENKYENIEICEFTFTHAQIYMDSVGKRKIVNRTYNNILQALKTCFNFLVERDYLAINPFSKQKKIVSEETEIIAFTNSELQLVSSTLPEYNYNLYVIALLVFNCFLRPQEIVRLKVRHLKELNKTLRIS